MIDNILIVILNFLNTIANEMVKGNFSFAILIVGIIQVIVMMSNKRKK